MVTLLPSTRGRRGPWAGPRLFCLPYAGGSARIFDDWDRDLPDSIEVCALELPGRGLRYNEEPLAKLDLILQDLLNTVLPYADESLAILGYSYGAFLGFELALRLEQDHGVAVRHLFAAAARAAVWEPKFPPGFELSDEEFRARLRAMNGTPSAVLGHEELMDLMIPSLRADFSVADHYSYQPGPLLNCPITAFGGAEDGIVSWESVEAWRACTNGRFAAYRMPGDHFFLRSARTSFLRAVASELREHTSTPNEAFQEHTAGAVVKDAFSK
ncbi:MAG: thioesterase [Pseudonocardiales bacterium]|nr:thioesterase [Pseudonocardiales bacterium]